MRNGRGRGESQRRKREGAKAGPDGSRTQRARDNARKRERRKVRRKRGGQEGSKTMGPIKTEVQHGENNGRGAMEGEAREDEAREGEARKKRKHVQGNVTIYYKTIEVD